MDTINDAILTAGDSLWTWLVLPLVAGLGIYFTVRSGAVQLRLVPEMVRTLGDSTPRDENGEPQSVSSFGAFTISAASRVGVGNIAGVGTAIAIGGAGAVFWMWLMAIIGAASAFVESTLAQLYKQRNEDGFHGGPAYYMQHGLKARWMGVLFAIILILCFPFAFSSLQANTIAATISTTVDSDSSALLWSVGVVVAALTGAVIFGGVRRIAHVTQAVVPAMALVYLLAGAAIVALNIGEVPGVVAAIVTDAFGFNEVVGATFGALLMAGVKRGMFSNEAGLGSAPNAGAAAAVTHPVKQGLVQSLGVYFDTLIVCSITAFIILVSRPDLAAAEPGIGLTQDALVDGLGSWANILLCVVIFLFAFSSILGNYYYGESNIEFITESKVALQVYRVLVVLAILAGAVLAADIVWNTADAIMGLMALVNLVAIALLSGLVWRLLADYTAQRRAGMNPVFTRDKLADVDGIVCWEDELSVTGEIPVVRP